MLSLTNKQVAITKSQLRNMAQDFHLHHSIKDTHDHHDEEHFNAPDVLRDIVIGMADGLTVPFALAAGLSSAVDNNSIIITAGIAEIIAGSIAMGLGGYLSGKTEYNHYFSELRREYDEVERLPEREKQEIYDLLGEYNLSENTKHQFVEELSQDKDRWVDFMMKFELSLEKPDVKRASKSAFNIAISYIIGGIVPLLPYFFTDKPSDGLIYSAAVTIVVLMIFGYIKSKIIGQSPWSGALKTASIGAIAAAAAYFIAKWIEHI